MERQESGQRKDERRYTILAVDDTPQNLLLINEVLGHEFQVKSAPDGERALRIAASATPPDLVLLDIMMPGIDGFEVCRRLQQAERTRNIPIIFLTAKGQGIHELQGLELGAVDCIVKPIAADQLRARVRVHLELARARQRLVEQNRLLQETVQLREEIERITRHDLKGPLSGIISMSEMLLRDPGLVEQHRKQAEIINRSGYRLLEMIDRSLDLFKMETGRYQLSAESVELLPLIERIWRDIEKGARRKRLELVVRVAGRPVDPFSEPSLVWGEELLLYSLFSNLMVNAVEAAPEGTVVEVDFVVEGDQQLVVVANAGAVPPAIRQCFFDKYVTAGKRHGTGLGTYSAQLIALTHGGDISMTSTEGAGTRIQVRLPRMPQIPGSDGASPRHDGRSDGEFGSAMTLGLDGLQTGDSGRLS